MITRYLFTATNYSYSFSLVAAQYLFQLPYYAIFIHNLGKSYVQVSLKFESLEKIL
jgi:hypothetical protein